MSSALKIGLKTSIAQGKLRVQSVMVSERLSLPFDLEFDLESRESALAFDDFLGQGIAAELELAPGKTRYWHGYVAAVAQTASDDKLWTYRVRAVPWLWFLTRTSDSRVFQGVSVPEIVTSVFRDRGFTDFDDATRGVYAVRDYCVQYRETDFNFVSRLLEEEGIYYYFKHEASRHVLVLADGYRGHAPYPGYDRIPFFPAGAQGTIADEHVRDWTAAHEITSGKYVLNDFDFLKPAASLLSQSSNPGQYAHANLEMYDYPGNFAASGDGERYARVRLEELQAQRTRARGEGDVRGMAAGFLFTLGSGSGVGKHPRSDQNREYLIVAAKHRLTAAGATAGGGAPGASEYAVYFEALDSSIAFRPVRSTPKPFVQGPQTATVVGPSGEEIWTDEHARIKVQFHWDRRGERNEKSSCWVRVAQSLAGDSFGAMSLPRLTQEVVVSFLEGDPDRPIVTGSVYNGDNPPPFSLPGEKTRSGFRSRSSKGGAAANASEFSFDDKKGEEKVLLHAEKDLTVEVEHDEQHTVDKSRKVKVGEEDEESIGKSQKIDVGKKYSLTAADEISLETGQSKIVLKKNGEITISGMKITIDAQEKLTGSSPEIKLDGVSKVAISAVQIQLDGTNVKISGSAMLDLSAAGKASLSGAITMIG